MKAANGFIRNYNLNYSDRLALLSSQISTINFNRVAIIVLLLSGVLAFHAMWVGQLGSEWESFMVYSRLLR
jgi:hypothetical protein